MTNKAIADFYTMPVGSPLEIAWDDDFFSLPASNWG